MNDVAIPLATDNTGAVLAEVTSGLESLVSQPENPIELTLPLSIEVDSAEMLALQLVEELNDLVAEERRKVISLEFGGMASAGSGYRLWGTIHLGASLNAPGAPLRIEATVQDGSLLLVRKDHQQ